MIRTLLKIAAYSKAPRTTFTVLHPKKAVRLKKFTWDMRHAPAPRVSAVGAAALALPLGLAIGRLTRRGPRPDRAPYPRTAEGVLDGMEAEQPIAYGE